jgi:nucleoside-diphosphate-sugar epimerase
MDNKDTILVTGATGYIGSRLLKKLCESGRRVRAMVMDNDPLLARLEGIECEITKGDIMAPGTLPPCLKGVKTVFHLAAVVVSGNRELLHRINYEGTKNLFDAAGEAGVEHFIYVSAAAAAYKERTMYGDSKLKSEALLQRQGKTKVTIIRPTLLYGAGGSRELKAYIDTLRRFPFIVPVAGMGRARKRPVWLEDIVAGLSLVIDNPVTYGKIYNFSGGTDISMREYTRLLCQTFGINKPLMGVPIWLCKFAAAVAPLFIKNTLLRRDTILGVTMDANFSFEEARRDIGYNPVGVEEGLRKAFADKRERL